MSEQPVSAYERWTWARCRDRILSLKNRMGYDERLWILGFELRDDGRLFDPYRHVEVFDPARAGPAITVPQRYSAVPEMYCILSTYAAAPDVPVSGVLESVAALDPVKPAGLTPEECTELLRYARHELEVLRAVATPFFSGTVPMADFAFVVKPLPRVPVTIALWHGDDDVDDGGTLFFDVSAMTILPKLQVELAGLTVWRLRNILNPDIKWGYHQLATR